MNIDETMMTKNSRRDVAVDSELSPVNGPGDDPCRNENLGRVIMKELSKQQIIAAVKRLDFPPGEYVVCGGAALAARGIKKTTDIDMVVSDELYARLKRNGWVEEIFENERPKVLFHKIFDVSTGWSVGRYQPNPAKLIAQAELIQEVPFVQLREVVNWKRACGRPKDLRDLKLIFRNTT